MDADCRDFFFKKKKILKELKHDPPEDFNCNLDTNRCHGLDWRTNLFAVCRALLAPLFGVTPEGIVAPSRTAAAAASGFGGGNLTPLPYAATTL